MATKASRSRTKDSEGQDGKWSKTLTLLPPEVRAIALIALIPDFAVIAVIKLLPETQRIVGWAIFAFLLFVTLIGIVLVILRSASDDHNVLNIRAKVERLKDRLFEKEFRPHLIVAIPRGGLVIAGLLAKRLGEDKIVPVICLSREKGFENSFNNLRFTRHDFEKTPVNVLILDDICHSGRTLAVAKTFVERSLNPGDFVVETAAISFYRFHDRAIAPSFFVDRPEAKVRDLSGEVD